MRMKRDRSDSPFVFTTLRGTHYTPTSRIHHWNRVRAAAGLGKTSLYLATRHYWGWYALNVLELEPHVIAEQARAPRRRQALRAALRAPGQGARTPQDP
jgi:hypothetical protein